MTTIEGGRFRVWDWGFLFNWRVGAGLAVLLVATIGTILQTTR